MIKQIDIDKVLDAANIVDVVSDFMQLKAAGSNMKGLCPFHDDSNPSFMVSPAKNICKCFVCGEGGGPVNFVMKHEGMTFPEAIRYLAKKYGIRIEEKEPTATEQEEYLQREAMYIANDVINREFQKQLLSNKKAQDYAYGRWGKEYCDEIGVGYCPPYANLVLKVGIKKEIAEMLKLINDKGSDFFFNRITIPIRNQQNRIIGFTARIPEDNTKKIKYLNSADSLLYNKSKSIFGINTAYKQATQSKTFFLVEGAPDCMRLQSIGVYNTVATLGSAWTEEQLKQLKRHASHLCFLPDADPPKTNGEHGPGINAVIRAGEMAMQMGFSVSVKQIPVTEEKNDPDSFCTSKDIFDNIEELDFVLWLADQIFDEGKTKEKQGEIVTRIAALLALIDNETTVSIYITNLIKKTGTKQLWRNAVNEKRKAAAEEEEKKKSDKESELYKQFGFNVVNDKYYYSISDNGGWYEWNNFIMTPLFHIKDTTNPKRIYKLKNVFGMEDLVEMKQEDLVSLAKFKQKIEGLGNYIWKATERELTKLKSFLYEKTETAIMISQMGWQRYGFYAFGNGIYYQEKFQNVDDYGIVRIDKGNFYLPANSKIYRDDIKLFQFERRFVHLGFSAVKLRDFSEQIFIVFGDNGRVGFIFYLATLFRDIVTRTTRSFPILNLFGPKGSGKSELGHTLMSFFIIENVPPNIQNSTIAALNDTVASVANALVHFDEYKNNLDIGKHEFLKGLWDGTGRTRMNLDDKKKETTSVDSGVILSGQEMPTQDIALFSRLIFLTFTKSNFSDQERKNYQALKQMRVQGMTHLTLEILNLRHIVEADFPVTYQKTMEDVNALIDDEMIEDRILMNWVSPLAVFRCLEAHLDTSLNYKQMLTVCVEGIKYQNAQCVQNNELAAFWNMVQYLVSEGEIIEGGDFRIVYINRLNTNQSKQIWLKKQPVLYFQKTRLFMLYKKHGKAVGDTLLSEGTLKYYLEKSHEYLGEKNGIRYSVYHRGVIQLKKGGAPGTEASVVQRSYCFDYNALVEKYKINLEIAPDDAKDTAYLEDENAAHPKQQELNLESS